MRCPKCGYISFDHIDTCLRCKKNIPDGAIQAEGTTFNVEAPSFLKIQSRDDTSSSMMDLDDDFGEIEEETLDVVDPDLDILLEDDDGVEGEHEGEIEFSGRYEEVGGSDFQISTDDEEDEKDFEIEAEDDYPDIDLGQFGDFEETTGEIEISMPDELNDISDLSAPAAFDDESTPVAKGASGGGQISGDGFDLNLDLDDLDSNFSLSSNEDDVKESGLGDLSFDDIGLSDEPAPVNPPPVKSAAFDDMDSDLDFDLDLGDLFKKKE